MHSKRILLFFLPILFLILTIIALKQNEERLYKVGCCQEINYSGQINPNDKTGVFEEKRIEVPLAVLQEDDFQMAGVLGVKSDEKRIEVSLFEQKLRAWDGDKLFLETPVSTGLPWWPTPKGEFRIWIKLRATKMEGGLVGIIIIFLMFHIQCFLRTRRFLDGKAMESMALIGIMILERQEVTGVLICQ